LQNYDGGERRVQMAFEWCTAVDAENRDSRTIMRDIWPGASIDREGRPEIDRNEMLLGGTVRLPHGRHPLPYARPRVFHEAKCLKI
jgi:hypothetical protein